MTAITDLDIEQWDVKKIKPYHNNPRVNDPAVDAVAASIQEFGFRQPIVLDEDGVIIVGHTLRNRGSQEPEQHSSCRWPAGRARAGGGNSSRYALAFHRSDRLRPHRQRRRAEMPNLTIGSPPVASKSKGCSPTRGSSVVPST